MYNLYYLADLAKEPTGVMFYKGRFHQFFYHIWVGDPYLGPVYKEATEYEIPKDDSTTEEGAEDQLAL